jgi:hypothetical protein
MLKKISATALFAVLALTLSLPALADTHKFKVINDGGHQIDHVYFSPISQDNWGPDKLGTWVIAPGHYHWWNINTDCEMDVKVIYHDGTKIVKQDFDTCKYDLKMSY